MTINKQITGDQLYKYIIDFGFLGLGRTLTEKLLKDNPDWFVPEDIKPCFFCHNNHIDITQLKNITDTLWHCSCFCGYQSKLYTTQIKAIAEHNKRYYMIVGSHENNKS